MYDIQQHKKKTPTIQLIQNIKKLGEMVLNLQTHIVTHFGFCWALAPQGQELWHWIQLLEILPLSNFTQVNQFLWSKCLDWNKFFWCSECGHSRQMYNILSIGGTSMFVMPCFSCSDLGPLFICSFSPPPPFFPLCWMLYWPCL